MKKNYTIWMCLLFVISLTGCLAEKKPQPLAYLSLEKPTGVINTKDYMWVKESFSRGGFFILNYNFRPAANIKSYIEQAEKQANTSILRNADVRLTVPLTIDVILFGYTFGTDIVTAKGHVHPQEK